MDQSNLAGDTRVFAILTERITKAYGRQPALRGIDLRIRPGERVALVGPNGAGKTTLLRILALLTRPTSGTIEIGGLRPSTEAQRLRATIGVSLHDSLLYPDLTVAENLRFFGHLYRVTQLDTRVNALVAEHNLEHFVNRAARLLSRGERQRASLARALLHDPPLLLLDEPDTGQDASSLERMRAILTDERRTVVFSTHQTAVAFAMATRVILLVAGRARDLGPVNALCEADLRPLPTARHPGL